MKKGRAISTTVAAVIVIIIVAAAGGAYYYSTQVTPAGHTTTQPVGSIGVVHDVGGSGDLSFNDMATLGATRAAKAFNLNTSIVDSPTQNDYVPNLEALARKTPAPILIVGVGFLLSDAVNKTAREFPKQSFAIVDGYVPGLPNVLNVGYKENEGSAVVGALAAFVASCYSAKGQGSNSIGVVLGIPIPVLYKFEIGYKWGVSWAKNYSSSLGKPISNVQVLWKYTNSFTDTTLGDQTATAQFSQGAVVSYNVAGLTGKGIFTAAQRIGSSKGQTQGPPFGIGVDSDQDWIAPGWIIASMMKRVDVGVYTATQLAVNGSFNSFVQSHGGFLTLGMKEGGIAMSQLSDLATFLPLSKTPVNKTDIQNKVQNLRNKITQDCGPVYDYATNLANLIKAGQIQVPSVTATADLNYWRSRYG